MNSSFMIRNILRYKNKNTILEFYKNQFETRDFINKTTKDLFKYNINKDLVKYNNYYLTKEFKNYKPNFKKTNVLDDSYIKYLDSMK